MARKHVAVHSADGSYSHHTTHPDAFGLVKNQRAQWITEFKAIQLIDSRIAPRGMNQRFDMHWKLIPSGGIPVWQYVTGERRTAKDGAIA